MFSTKLPYDFSRCHGSACKERESCLRFTTIAEDKLITEPCRISYADNMCYDHDGMTIEWVGGYKIASTNAKEV